MSDPSRENADLHLLFRVVNLMHASLDPEEIARITLTAITAGSALGMNRAAFFRLDGDSNSLRGCQAVGPATREEAMRIWASLEKDPAPLEELVQRAIEPAPGRDEALRRRVCEIVIPAAAAASGPLRAALEGKGAGLRAGEGLPAELSRVFDGPVGLVLPLRVGEIVFGVVVADCFAEGPDFSTARMDLALEVAHQAGIAFGNAEQLVDVRTRAAQLSSLHELGKRLLASTDLSRELVLLARCASEVTSAQAGVLWLSEGSELQLKARWARTDAAPDARLEARLSAIAAAVARSGEVAGHRDAADAEEGGPGEALLCVPLRSYGRVVGALAVHGRIPRNAFETPDFTRHDRQFLGTLADFAAIALENLRLMNQTREAERRLREAQSHLLRSEKLAALGEMSAKVAHEVRNPLAAIGGFARRVGRTLAQTDPNHEPMEIIIRETERLERIVSEQLQFAQLARRRLRMEDLNSVLNETLQLVGQGLVERRARLVKRLAPDLPALLLDADKIKQVMLNIVQNALQNVSQGGRIKVETKRLRDTVHVEVANDGPKIAGEMLERLFVPFNSSRESGTGLGLAVADQIVREHGGEIRVRSDGDWGCIFAVVLPIKDNGDRRSGMQERRDRRRSDRRSRAA